MTTLNPLLPKPWEVAPAKGANVFVGIDPGAKGGIAALVCTPSTNRLVLWKMPLHEDGSVDGSKLDDFLSECHCYPHYPRILVERVGGAPRQAGQFQFGLNTGVIHGVLGALGLPWALIHPVQWNGLVGLAGGDPATKKARSIELAKNLFPEYAGTIGKHDGLAEAALLAYINAYRLGAVRPLTHYGNFYV